VKPWAPWALALAVIGSGEREDRVVLVNGKELRGRVLFQDDTTVVLRQGGRDTELARAEIQLLDTRLADLAVLLDNAERADLGRARDLELLAAQAEEMGLPGEAQVFWWRLVRLDPSREDARRALGHERRGAGWSLPLGRRRVDESRRHELARDWGTGWEFASLHYRLRTNLPLDVALDVLLDLERVYAAFLALFGAELRLHDVTRPLSVHLHADSASYPETANEFGTYDVAADVVHVNAAAGLDFTVLAHELTHQLLYDTAFREREGSSGCLPGWLDEGLADYVAAGVTGFPGVEFEPGRKHAQYFDVHARTQRPLDLARVLTLSQGDYFASTERLQKYAQSYTLVHYLLHGDGARHHAGFTAFLRAVYAGKGSSTDLRKALGVDWRELERGWSRHAGREP
jgi:hypothetical protein